MYSLQPISVFPQCKNDISFWLPENESYSMKDFCDLARYIGGDRVEQIILNDVYTHPVTKRVSHCYTIVYRHMERTLLKIEVNNIHSQIGKYAAEKLHVTVR